LESAIEPVQQAGKQVGSLSGYQAGYQAIRQAGRQFNVSPISKEGSPFEAGKRRGSPAAFRLRKCKK
jgi:hypothetical protein